MKLSVTATPHFSLWQHTHARTWGINAARILARIVQFSSCTFEHDAEWEIIELYSLLENNNGPTDSIVTIEREFVGSLHPSNLAWMKTDPHSLPIYFLWLWIGELQGANFTECQSQLHLFSFLLNVDIIQGQISKTCWLVPTVNTFSVVSVCSIDIGPCTSIYVKVAQIERPYSVAIINFMLLLY